MAAALRATVLALDVAGWLALFTFVIGCGVGGAIWLARAALSRGSARLRCAMCCAALLLLCAVPGVFGRGIVVAYGSHGRVADGLAADLMARPAVHDMGPLPGGWTRAALSRAVEKEHNRQVELLRLGRRAGAHLGGVMALLGLGWVAATCAALLRLVRELRAIGALRAAGGREVQERWIQVLRRVARRLGVRRPVRVLVCDHIDGPVLVGWRRPLVLLPPNAHEQLSDGHAEAVLAHELAHVRRADYPINLLQAIVEAVLVFHPVTRWLGEWVREEREFSADDLAARAIAGTTRDYARALSALESLRVRDLRPHMVRAHGGPLLRRIRRLAAPVGRTPAWDAAIVLAVLCVLTVSVVRLSRGAIFAAHAVMSHELGLPRDFERIAERGPLSSSRR